MELLKQLFKGDKVIWLIFFGLCVVSVIEGFSAMGQLSYKTGDYWGPILKHSTYLIAGVGIILVMHNIPYKYFSAFIIFLPIAALLLVVVMLVGDNINDASRWLEIFGFSFQPSEFAKLSLMVSVAFLLSRRRPSNELKIFYWIMGITVVICLLIGRDNFSTAGLLFALVVFMLVIARLELKKLTLVFLVLGASLVGIYFLHKKNPDNFLSDKFHRIPTMVSRIDKFRSGEEMPLDDKYEIDAAFQVSHAKIAVARGGLVGRFPGNSQQRDFLPQPYSDFIYAIILEEIGLVGGLVVMFFYFFLLFRVGLIAGKCKRSFARYLLYGCGLILVMQALANMAVAVNLVPVTGQPLPLISRGGTSILITCVYFGIILSVSRFEIGLGEEEEEGEEIMAEKVSDAELLAQDDSMLKS